MGSNNTIIERDSVLINLERNVFSKLNELTKDHEIVKRPEYKNTGLKTFSVEDAIRELKEMGEI